MAGEAVELRGVRPVRLDRDYVETVLLDQASGDGGAGAVEVVGAVAGFADQHHAGIAVTVEAFAEGAVVRLRQWLGVAQDQAGQSACVMRRLL